MIAGIALMLTLLLHLVPALMAGLLVYELVHLLAPRLHILRIRRERAKLAALGLLATGVVLLLGLAVAGTIAFLRSDAGSLDALLKRLA